MPFDSDDMRCDCSRYRTRQPDHFLISRFKTPEFQDQPEFKPCDNFWDAYALPSALQLAKKWNDLPLISEPNYILVDENDSPQHFFHGQSVKEYLMEIKYVHLGKSGVYLELTAGKKKDEWGRSEETIICTTCKKTSPVLKWMYCSICRSGPYWSEPCRLKCIKHQGYRSIPKK